MSYFICVYPSLCIKYQSNQSIMQIETLVFKKINDFNFLPSTNLKITRRSDTRVEVTLRWFCDNMLQSVLRSNLVTFLQKPSLNA